MTYFKKDRNSARLIEVEFIPHQEIIINTQKLNMNWREHLKSFLITFFVGFAMVFVADLDKLSLDTLGDGALLGLLFGAIRAGVKSALELFIALYSGK